MNEKPLLKIGDFSRLSHVSIKALRHYDDLGLLPPAYVDEQSSYRYYAVEQLPRIHSILALRNLGLSLTEISRTVDASLGIAELRRMLRMKRAELRHRIGEERKLLEQVEFRLQMLEAEADFPPLDVVVKHVDPLRVLALRLERHHPMGAVVEALKRSIATGDIRFSGTTLDVLSTHEHRGELVPHVSPHEVVLSVNADQPGDVEIEDVGTMVLRNEPGLENAASLVFQGLNLEQRHLRFALLQRWAVAQGHRLPGRARILHHVGPLQTLDRSAWVTELQLAIETEPSDPQVSSSADDRAGTEPQP